MTCDQTIERLPWLLNGTLDAEERGQAQGHLETCPHCREALAETREAWRIFSQHLPSEALVAMAYGETPGGIDPGLAERHLSNCAECAAELELARMSRRLEEDDRIATFPVRTHQEPARGSRAWRNAALAAGLAGVVAFSGWFQAAQRVRLLPEIQRQQAQLKTGMAEMSSRFQEIAQPQINTPAPELHPDVERGASDEISIPAGQIATPVLYADRAVSPTEREVAILDATGKPVWRRGGLQERSESSDFRYFTLTLIPGFLAPGHYTIQLYTTENGQRTPRESYKIHIE